jgi:hypothetical protein
MIADIGLTIATILRWDEWAIACLLKRDNDIIRKRAIKSALLGADGVISGPWNDMNMIGQISYTNVFVTLY